MKKALLFLFAIVSYISYGQDGPTFITNGTFKGKTIPLRDFAIQQVKQYIRLMKLLSYLITLEPMKSWIQQDYLLMDWIQ